MKAKQALLDAGRIEKIGKGRISRDNHAWLEDQVLNHGLVLSDYKVETKTVEGKATVVKSNSTVPAAKVVQELAAPLWPNGTKATAVVDGKTVNIGLPSACMDCGYSLQWCYCHLRPTPCKPRVVAANGLGYVRVSLEVPSSYT